MHRVIDAACSMQRAAQPAANPSWDIPDSMQEAAASIARSLPVTKILAITRSGYAARRLANCQLPQPILAISNEAATARAFNMLPGTKGIFIDVEFPRTGSEHIPYCLKRLWLQDEIVAADLILVISLVYPKSGNRMNLIELHRVADLVETFGWSKNIHSEPARTSN
jgi:pyruvate kinase